MTRLKNSFLLLAFCGALLAKDELNYSKCKEFYIETSRDFSAIDSANIEHQTRAIHIGGGKYLAFSNIALTSPNLLKGDSVLGLYLFSGENLSTKYDFANSNNTNNLIAINSESSAKINIKSPQRSLISLGNLDKNIAPNAAISDICYQLHGLSVGENKFISSKYLKIFFKTNAYSQIPFKLSFKNGAIIIENVNPLANLNLQKGDKILKINGKTFNNLGDLEDFISLLAPDSKINLMLERGDRILNIAFNTQKKRNKISQDSFLEYIGIAINSDLIIQNNILDFRIGDKILRLNQNKLDSIERLNEAILEALMNEKNLSFLILRQNFELFITIKIWRDDEFYRHNG